MESDKFGTLVRLREFTSKLTKPEDFGFLLNEFTRIIGIDMMHKIIYSGFYKYYQLLQSQQIQNLMSITLTHCQKIHNKQKQQKQYSKEKDKNINDIRDPIERDVKYNIINNILPCLSIDTLEILIHNRNINDVNNMNKSELIKLLKNNIIESNTEAIKHYNTYLNYEKNELLAECKLYNVDNINNNNNNVDILKHKLYTYINTKLFGYKLMDLHTAIISNICQYLDIKSLLLFELCNRIICSGARRPSSCIAFDTSPSSPSGSQFAFTHYIASKYSSFCKIGIVPDIHRFIHTKEWNITLSPFNKYQFDPTSSTGSRYTHCIMRGFMGTPFQKRLLSLSVNLGQIQLDPDVPFPYHENLETLNCTKIHPLDILRVLNNYPSHKFKNLSFTELILCNFYNVSDQLNYENFYRFLHILLPSWNKYYPSNKLSELKYYPGETYLLSKFENIIQT
eukprot:480879_1